MVQPPCASPVVSCHAMPSPYNYKGGVWIASVLMTLHGVHQVALSAEYDQHVNPFRLPLHSVSQASLRPGSSDYSGYHVRPLHPRRKSDHTHVCRVS